ncbi:MAG: hypothetical protein K5773_04800 [Pseudobutyrivibrio sp.]|nr:hypothetical protein [Pseudobutyrivibrio sp.]
MKISNSEVAMTSQARYQNLTKVKLQAEMTPKFTLDNLKFIVDEPKEEKTVEKGRSTDPIGNSEGDIMSSMNYALGSKGEVQEVGEPVSEVNKAANKKIRLETMSYLIRMLLWRKILGEDTDFDQIFGEMMGGTGSGGGYMETTTASYEHYSSQSLVFESSGTAVLEDGRELSFNYSFAMSETLYEKTEITSTRFRNYIDPLVVNLSGNPTSISDQSFYFDLDGDGMEEDLARLGLGSGFLAFDRDESGDIENGLELFGPSTGDGFKELAGFDLDRNGWIDENDEIFDKLRILTINEEGQKELYGLKESDVGAIYLGRIGTFFDHHDNDHNSLAQTKESGIFLRESDGSAGGVSHVDFAT